MRYSIFKVNGKETGGPMINVLQDSIVDIELKSTDSSPGRITLQASLFHNRQNMMKSMKISWDGRTFEDSITGMNDSNIRFKVNAGKIGKDDQYKGFLLISREGEKIGTIPLVIQRLRTYRPAVIKLNRNEINFSMTGSNDSFSFIIREDSLKSPIYNLRAQIIEDDSERPIDIRESIVIKNKQNERIDLLSADSSAQSINLEEGEYYLITMELLNIDVGKRTLKMAFTAANASNINPPILTVHITKKDHWGWAVAVIIIAIIFTLVTKKFVAIRDARITIRKRAEKISNAISDQIPYNMAKIRVKRIIKMALEVSKKSFSKFEECDHDLNTAEEITAFLQRTTDIYNKISRMPTGMQKRRAKKNYDHLLVELARMQFDKENKTKLITQIEELESWFEDNNFDTKYGVDLDKDIQYFLQIFDIDRFDPKYTEIINLYNRVEDQNDQKREDAYAVLKILWETRKETVFDDIYNGYMESQDVDDVFEKVDNFYWKRLKTAQGNINFVQPRNSGDPFETFQGINFEIEPRNDELGDNYLFKHGLKYEWSITIREDSIKYWQFWKWLNVWNWRPRKIKMLKTLSCSPKIRQFSPITGKLEGHVEVFHKDEHFKVEMDEKMPIAQSTSTQISTSTKINDGISSVAAAIIGILTGITSYYLNQELFGSAEDYILLFLWGAGIEQGTSFLTYLKQDS